MSAVDQPFLSFPTDVNGKVLVQKYRKCEDDDYSWSESVRKLKMSKVYTSSLKASEIGVYAGGNFLII